MDPVLQATAMALGFDLRPARTFIVIDETHMTKVCDVKATHALLAARGDDREAELQPMLTREYAARYAMGEMDA